MSDPAINETPETNVAPSNNKRKREDADSAGPDPRPVNRSSNGSNSSIPDQANFAQSSLTNYDAHAALGGADLNIDQQIFQHVGQNGMTEDTALTAKAALAAHNPQQKYPPPPEASFDTASGLGAHGLPFAEEISQSPIGGNQGPNSTAAAVYAAREAQNINQKPSVGSPEWHQIRKSNHKEGREFNYPSRKKPVG